MPRKATVAVSEVELTGEEDWFTPKVLKVAPLRIEATLGKKGQGRVRCAIEETDWQHRYVDLELTFERVSFTGVHSSTSNEVGSGPIGTFTRDQIDRLIDALVLVRREADERGLFVSRQAPKTAAEVLASADEARPRRLPRKQWPRIARS